jgi:hypothetical protein
MMTNQNDSLPAVLESSRLRLETAARGLSSAHGIAERGNAAAAMARESLFAEAMLAEVHARFAEAKEVTR